MTTLGPSPSDWPPTEQARAFVRAVLGDGDALVGRMANIWTAHDRRSYWLPADNPDAIANKIIELDAEPNARAVYLGVGVGDRAVGTHRRLGNEDVTGLPGVAVDIDIAGEGHSSKQVYPPTEADALRIAQSLCLPDGTPLPPTAIIHSGGGLQARWRFAEPWLVSDGDDPEVERKKLSDFARDFVDTLRLRANRLGGWDLDPVGDLARVMRVPGTTNRKIDGRPRLVRLLHLDPAAVYEVSDLAEALAERGELDTMPGSAGSTVSADAARVVLAGIDLHALWRQVTSPAYAARKYLPKWSVSEVLRGLITRQMGVR